MAALDQFDLNGALQNLFRFEPTAEEKQQAAYSALGKMGLGILAANQPSREPRNYLGVLGQGGIGAFDEYRKTSQELLNQRRTSGANALAGAKVAAELDKEKRQEKAMDVFGSIGPDILKDPQALYKLGVQQSAAGNEKLGNGLINIANHAMTLQNRRDPSQMERALEEIGGLHRKSSMGQDLTPEEQTKLHNAVAVVGQVRQALDPVTQTLQTFQPLTLPDIYKPTLERYGVKLAKPSDVFPPAGAPGRKQLDSGSEKELQGFNDAATQLFSLHQDFDPSYGGWKLDTIGQAALMAGRRLPQSTLKSMGQPGLQEQAQWWQRYYNWSNDVRAAKFGLTLTGNELTAFEKATPKPSDDPAVIESGIKKQLEILGAKRANRIGGLEAGGYNPAQVRETAGTEYSVHPTEEQALGAVRDATARGQKAQSTWPQQPKKQPKLMRGQVVNGYRYNGGDPNAEASWEPAGGR